MMVWACGFCKARRYNTKLGPGVHEEVFASIGVENVEKCAVDPGRQVVYCRPVGPFPVFEAVWNLQGWRQDLACSPNFEWYRHNPGRRGHFWSDLVFTLWFPWAFLCPGKPWLLFWAFLCPGLRRSSVALTCSTLVSLDASVILSACIARSSISVFSDEARILLTSEGS